jgi:hypothetical protein
VSEIDFCGKRGIPVSFEEDEVWECPVLYEEENYYSIMSKKSKEKNFKSFEAELRRDMMEVLQENYLDLTSRYDELSHAERVLHEWSLVKMIELCEEDLKIKAPEVTVK